VTTSKAKKAKPAAKKKGGPRVATVRGISMAKVDDTSLTAYLTAVGVKIPDGTDTAHKVELYMDFTDGVLEKMPAEEDYGECENCEAPCPPEGPHSKACPVCGEDHEDSSAPTAAAPIAKTSGDLDKEVAEFKSLFDGAMQNYWQMGDMLVRMHESKLYKTRVGSDEKPLYRSFEKFVEAELGITAHHARDLMTVAVDFTERQVIDLGTTKLKYLARVPVEKRPPLLERAKTLSTRDLEKEVKKFGTGRLRTARSEAQQEARKKATEESATKAQTRKKQADAGKAVSVVFQVTEYELPLRVVGDGKFIATEEHINNVTTTYEVVTKGKRRYIRVKHERQPEA
jgi:hypothetical protein